MAVIRDMLKKVEDDHATYLQQLGQMQQETRLIAAMFVTTQLDDLWVDC
jgi:hypothetical protein